MAIISRSSHVARRDGAAQAHHQPTRLTEQAFGADLHRPVGEAVGESLEMLFDQQRGGAEQRDLLAVGDGNERGAQPDAAPLHKLGSGQWDKARRRAAQQVRDTAAELLAHYA